MIYLEKQSKLHPKSRKVKISVAHNLRFQVDYRFVQGNPWTDNKGCDFLEEPCIKDGEPTDDNFCIQSNGRSGCDPNHFQGKFCSSRANFPYLDPGCGAITNKATCLNNRGIYCNWVGNRCEFRNFSEILTEKLFSTKSSNIYEIFTHGFSMQPTEEMSMGLQLTWNIVQPDLLFRHHVLFLL